MFTETFQVSVTMDGCDYRSGANNNDKENNDVDDEEEGKEEKVDDKSEEQNLHDIPEFQSLLARAVFGRMRQGGVFRVLTAT